MFILNSANSIANHYLAELRDVETQKDSLRFRRNLERLGELLAYEISKTFTYEERIVKTPLGESKINFLKEQPVLLTILRAGIPFFQGFLNVFDKAESGFVGAFRTPYINETEFEIAMDYMAVPDFKDRHLIIIDPMLATGRSLVKSISGLMNINKPSHIHIVSVIASQEGAAFVKSSLEIPHTLWTAAVDDELNSKSYIVPGLGDAGDLAFGKKL